MIADYYDQDVVILNYSTSTGDYWSTSTGGHWDTDEKVKAAVNLMGSGQKYVGDAHQILADYKLFCAPTTTLTENSRVRWDGDTFDVVELKNTLQKDAHYRALLKRRYV
jgi:hypothetical protein